MSLIRNCQLRRYGCPHRGRGPTKKHPVPSDGLHECVCIEHFLHKTLFIYITVQYDTTLLVARALELILCPWEDPSRHSGHTGQQVQNDT